MKNQLKLSDIINLEYLFHEDREKAPAALHKRDREICLALEKEQTKVFSLSQTAKLSGWIQARIQQEFPAADSRNPGEIFDDTVRFASLAVIILGVLFGALAGLAFFSYTGKTPVNVFQFLLLFIGTQLLLILLRFSSSLLRRLLPQFRLPGFYSLLLERSFSTCSSWLRRGWLSRMSAGRQNSINQAFALARVKSGRYGHLFYWLFFCLTQLFGFTFNIVLLTVTLIKITTSDLAFGWQSTIQFSDTAVHAIVQTLALPWSWLLGSNAAPGLEAIAGSRIILKDNIYHLVTADLTSWWPFLVMCLLVYGVLTRFAFLFFGKWRNNTALAHLPINSPQCKSLLRRMGTPLVTTQAPAEALRETVSGRETKPDTGTSPIFHAPVTVEHETPSRYLSEQLVLVGIDLYEQLSSPQDEITATLTESGFTPLAVLPCQSGWEEDQQLLERIKKEWLEKEGIVIILEGWMVPLVDFLSYLGEIRAAIPGDMVISIALVGRRSGTLFTPVTRRDFTIWKQKVEALADPYLHLFPLIAQENDA
ncbi:DUF2868 domain-containing protein [Desulforhopalus vacuolatus]|uniref:DUF2868 domain-containing protein n=1 Tax=Desulforhopalus vacuolatus TaxID=40414 RepID=UPI001965ED83|nr:DUF2868 domain-containing protein [Desulforhopalus vacuolatus]MBM9518246.1 DUF2868 domain-containing protein [Desulforhopalus vacuolatus]